MEQRSSISWRRIILVLLCLGIPIGVLLWPRESAPPSTRSWASINLRRLHFMLSKYAEKNNDRLPPSLAAIGSDLVQAGGLEHLRFRETETRNRYDWLYFPAPKLSTLSAEYILIAAPKPLLKPRPEVRMVLYPNGAISAVKEAEYQQRIRSQMLRYKTN